MAGGASGKQLGLGRLVIFSLPVLLIQAIEIPWRVYLPPFLVGPLGFELALVGTFLAAIRLFDTGFDLFVGWASDRWPTRFGRRKPWMAAGVPLIMTGSTGVFLAQPGEPFAALAASALVLHVGYTMVVTPHGGWGLEIGRSPRERLRVITAKTWMGALGIPVVLLLPSVLERTAAADRTVQMRAMGVAILILAPVIISLVLRAIREPNAVKRPIPGVARPHVLKGVTDLLRNRDAAKIAILYSLAGLTEATSSGSFIFFVEGPLGLKGWASTLLLIQAAIALVSLPAWAWLGARIGKTPALKIAFGLQAFAMALVLVLPTGAVAATLALLAIRYTCWGADFLFLRAMVADLAGEAMAAGQNSSATHYAAFNVPLRISLSLGAGLVLWIPALLGTSLGDGSPFDDAVRLVFTVPACLGATCGLLLLTRRRAPRLLPTAKGGFA